MSDTDAIIRYAFAHGFAVPAFNVPHLPMIRPIIEAIIETDSFALIEVARLEWRKFGAVSVEAVYDEYRKWADPRYVRLHLDHIPVIDEDGERVDFLAVIREAVETGYDSVMVDGSRLPLEHNIETTRAVVDLAHDVGVPVEAELGAVLGHEAGPLPPYEDLFRSGRGFTDPGEAAVFVERTGVDWLSVAFGNIHGAIGKIERKQAKPKAKLDIGHLEKLVSATEVPMVLHGGSAIPSSYVRRAIGRGIAKINIGADVRRPYERALAVDPSAAADAAHDATVGVIERLGLRGRSPEIARVTSEEDNGEPSRS